MEITHITHLLEFTLIFAYVIHGVSSCDGASPKYGNMTKDYDILVGSPLTVRCNLFTHHISANNTQYYVTSDNLLIKFEKSVLMDLVIVDPYTIEYSIENATINDTGVYNCFLSIPRLNYSPFVCTTYIAVGYPPLPVQNFSCISQHYKNLTCSWTKPFNPVKTDYIIWDFLQLVALKRRCPERLNSTSCQWRVDTYPPYRKAAKTLYYLIVGNNSLGTNKEFLTIDHFKYVKPAAVQKLHFMNITKNSLVVTWSAPSGMEYNDFPPGLVYSIRYHPLYPPDADYKEVESVQGLTYHLMENFIPYTEYEFIVRSRSSVADDEKMWSPTVGLTVRTLPDVPYLAPGITFSSYEAKTILGNRSIALYWKSIPAEYQNGEDFQYLIEHHIHYVRTKRENSVIEVGNVTSYVFEHMDPNSAYLFKIYAKNKVGVSSNQSVIVVDKASKQLKAPKDIAVLSHGRGNYTVSWKPDTDDFYSYTLFWCQEVKPWPFKCEGPLEWMHTTETYHKLKLNDKDTNYQFAVTANDGVQTSGMKWATCFVPYSGVLYKVRSVNLIPKNATSIEVQWTLDCDAQRTVIKEYAINYCKVDSPCTNERRNESCAEKLKGINITQPLKEEIIISNLKPYACYRIYVRARTEAGWSEDSSAAYERTLSTAPSDPPRNVKVLHVNETSINVRFQPPFLPNGKITRYVITYRTSTYPNAPKHEYEILADGHSTMYSVEISQAISHYTNYSIAVSACVGQSCSPASRPVYALTGIGNPGIMESPHIEMVNSSYVNISWKPPNMANGPLNVFQVSIRWKESNKEEEEVNEINEIYNVTGKNYLAINLNCPVEPRDETMYFISVRAINIKEGQPLFGQASKETQTTLCFAILEGPSYGLVVGITAGCALGLLILILIVYSLATWMKTEVDLIKGINVQLPKGLDVPVENPISTYDKFKNGLQKGHDSGVPNDRAYERLCSFASEGDTKDVEGGYIISAEEMAQKGKREQSGRNHSGESNISGKGHDSISSSITAKTHISIDSGTEVDSPPSPDGFFSDSSSSNTTPRSYKPDLAIVKEGIDTNSKDSGLEKELMCSTLPGKNSDLPSKFAWYVKKKNHPYSNIQFQKCTNYMPAYSKFSVMAPANISTYIPFGEQGLNLMDHHSLSNSEPSVADFEDCSDSNPLVLPGMSPYSKFGLARSAGNGLNVSNPSTPVHQNVGYSKFGIVYRVLKCQDGSSAREKMALHPAELTSCPKIVPINNTQAMTSLVFHTSPVLKNSRPTTIHSKSPLADPNDKMLKKDMSIAYSKFGVHCPNPKRKESQNGYVSFHDALHNPVKEDPTKSEISHSPKMSYSKFGVNANHENKTLLENGVDNAKALRSSPSNSPKGKAYSNFGFLPEVVKPIKSGYVSFQDAKVMPAENAILEKNEDVASDEANNHASDSDDIDQDITNTVIGTNNDKTLTSSEAQTNRSGATDDAMNNDASPSSDENPDLKCQVNGDVCPNSKVHQSELYKISDVDDISDIICSDNGHADFHPFRVEPLIDNDENLSSCLKTEEQERFAKAGVNATSKGYVPLSELSKESTQITIRPNSTPRLHAENV